MKILNLEEVLQAAVASVQTKQKPSVPAAYKVIEQTICACGAKLERSLGIAKKTRNGLEFLLPTGEPIKTSAESIYIATQTAQCESCHPRALARRLLAIVEQNLADPETRRLVEQTLQKD